MRPGFWIFVFAAAAASLPSSPQALTIEEALAEAARSNPTVRAAREAARAGHQGVPLARAAWLPTIRAGVGANFTRTGSRETFEDFDFAPVVQPDDSVVFFATPRTRLESHDSAEQTASLTWTQTLYHGGRNLAGLRRAKAQVLQHHASVEDAEQAVLLRAATAYLDVLRASQAVTLHAASLAAFEARQKETVAQYKIGDRTRADVAQAMAEREVANAELLAARADLANQRALFEALVGIAADGLKPAEEPAGLPDSLETARLTAREDRPAVRAALHAERAAVQAVRVAAGDLGPRFDLRGDAVRRTGHALSAPDSTDLSAGLRMTVPLYQAGAVGARLRQARRLRAQRRDELQAAEREALQRATSAWNDLEAARRRHAALLAAVKASQAALANIHREADVGERTTREVLDAERDLVSRRVRALSAKRDAVVGAYRLLEAVGALTARRLGIKGLPDLTAEAQRTRRSIRPDIFSIIE